MSHCPHTPKYPDVLSIPSMQEALSHCSLVEDDQNVARQRALTSADGLTTRIDAGYWGKLDDGQRAAVVAHERAHPQIGMEIDCEGCADKVGGFYMRAWGYAPAIVRSSFSTLRVKRDREHGDIADNAAAGAKAAERGLAGRGLLGSSNLLTQTAATITKKETSKTVADNLLTRTAATFTPTTPSTSPIARSVGQLSAAMTGTQAEGSPPSTDASRGALGSVLGDTKATANADRREDARDSAIEDSKDLTQVRDDAFEAARDSAIADAVSSVLGERARPHAVPVLIAAGVAVIVAVVLVVVVRRGK